MEGDKQKKTKSKQGSRRDKGETVEESYENNGDANEDVQAIYDENRALRSYLKCEMSEFRLSIATLRRS